MGKMTQRLSGTNRITWSLRAWISLFKLCSNIFPLAVISGVCLELLLLPPYFRSISAPSYSKDSLVKLDISLINHSLNLF